MLIFINDIDLLQDGSRAITPDTESELPTDNEITDSKSASSSTSGQQTPTPENEGELENSELTTKTDNLAPIRMSDVSNKILLA